MGKLGDALANAARGFRVIRLKAGGWTPAFKGWQEEATTDEATIRRWWGNGEDYNIGIATGQGLLVLDVDNKNGKNGSASLVDLDLPLECLETFTVKTPSGGFHVYFTGPSVANSAGRLGDGLDVRSDGGYVVGAGSVLPDGAKNGQPGGRYALAGGEGLCPAPSELTSRLRLRGDVEAQLGQLSAASSALAVDYLTSAPLAIEGKGGDHDTFVVAAHLKDLGVEEIDAFDLMAEHWNPRCEPPWDDHDLRVKISNAYRYSENPPGFKAPEAEFGDVSIPAIPKRQPSKFFRHGQGWNQNESWLFYEICPRRGVCVLVGETQSGKTFLEIEIARCGATGKPFFKIEPDEKFATIFVFTGTEGSGLAKRFAALQEETVLPISATIAGNLNKPGALKDLLEDLQTEAAYIKETFGVRVGLVVVETLAASGLLPHENDAGEASAAMHNLSQIANAMDVLVMTSHHPAKGTHEARGSGAVPAAADYVISIQRRGRDKVRQVELVKARDAEQRSLGSFSLVPVILGQDAKGRNVTSMSVSMGEPGGAPAAKTVKHMASLMEAIEWAAIEKSIMINCEPWISKTDAWHVFRDRSTSVSDESNKHRAFRDTLQALEDQGVVESIDYHGTLCIRKREIIL